MANCHYHPMKFASGLCVRCKRTICRECCTQLDGINHCHACLDVLSARPVVTERGVSPGQIILLLLVWFCLFWMFWLASGSLAP